MRPLSAFFIAISFVTTNGNLFISRHSNQAPAKWPTLNGLPPVLFGHGGEKFYLPEHTTGSYWLAAVEGIFKIKCNNNNITQSNHNA